MKELPANLDPIGGGEVKFRRVYIHFSESDYYLCCEGRNSESTIWGLLIPHVQT